jgi:hypothetical protein
MTDWANLTPRDRDVLYTLTHKVRCLSLSQAARVWWSDSKQPVREAGRRLRAIGEGGLLDVFDALARPDLELSEPVIVWEPGYEPPDFAALCYRLKARWNGSPARRTRMLVATKKATKFLGGHGGRRPRTTEVTHDLHLASVYCRMLLAGDRRAKKWVSEAELYARGWGRGQKLPDALIQGRRGKHTVIELAGDTRRRN